MDDSQFALIGDVSLVEELLQLPQGFAGSQSDHVEFVPIAGWRADRDRRYALPRAFHSRTPQPFGSDLDAKTAPAYHCPAGFKRQQFSANFA